MATTKTNLSIAYCMSDMAASDDGNMPAGVVSIPRDAGGCGEQHRARVDDQGHPYIQCDVCAPVLTGTGYGFASTPAGVPLTPDEMGEVEIGKRQGERSYSMAMQAMGETMGRMLQQGQIPGSPLPAAAPQLDVAGLKALLGSLSPAERAALLGPATPADGTADAPGEPGGTGTDDESVPAVKRGGSRSRPVSR
jgi:hypothetical protein